MHVTKIQVGRDILVLGDAETLRGLPRDLRRRSAVCGVLRRMMTDPHAMRQLRQYWGSRSLAPPDGRRTDHELIEVVEAAVESGAVPAMVLPDLGPHVRNLGAAVADTGWRRPDAARPVAQMTAEERIWAVVTRAAKDLPRATGDALLALFTPENIAIAAGLAGLSAAANLTPLGWAADGVMIAVAVGFGGMAAIQGVKDLVQCFYLTVNATRDADLDQAAEHLARVVADFGVIWLMALLHERASRGKAGGEGEALDSAARDTVTRSPRRLRSLSTAERESPPAPPAGEPGGKPPPGSSGGGTPPPGSGGGGGKPSSGGGGGKPPKKPVDPAKKKAIEERQAANDALRNSPQFAEDQTNRGITPEQMERMWAKEAPLGFKDAEQFAALKTELNEVLGRSGLDDAEVGLKGTSTTFYSENPGKPLGHHWDADPENPGDYDFDIDSPNMVSRMKDASIEPSQKYDVYKTADLEQTFPDLRVFAEKWSDTLGRDVNFVGYPEDRTVIRDKTDYMIRGPQ